jgi:hypothetical protein
MKIEETKVETKPASGTVLWGCRLGWASVVLAVFAAGTLLLLAVCRVVSVPSFVPIGLFAFSAFGYQVYWSIVLWFSYLFLAIPAG